MPILSGQSKPFRPKGRPVDKLDGYCKSLNDAYECIAQDNLLDKNGDICDFKNTPKILTDNWQVEIDHDINSATTSIKTDAELKQACLTLNNNIDSCEVYICMIEANFLIQLWDPNQDFLNSNDVNQYGYAWETSQQSLSSNDLNGFNPYDQCLVNFNTASSAADDKSCCGEYPNRLTYRSKGGIFSCCNGKTFNSLMHACCDNNGNQVVGDIGC